MVARHDAPSVIISQGPTFTYLCLTGGVDYVPDQAKHHYGQSPRKPLEAMFLDVLRFFNQRYPGFEIFTLGSSMVFGEKFLTYFTACEFELRSPKDLPALKAALHESDMRIRGIKDVAWDWTLALVEGDKAVLVVGWLDFAYFLQHRKDFLDMKHGNYMAAFVKEQTSMKGHDFKVLQGGEIVPFDEKKLSPRDAAVFANFDKISFERIHHEPAKAPQHAPAAEMPPR